MKSTIKILFILWLVILCLPKTGMAQTNPPRNMNTPPNDPLPMQNDTMIYEYVDEEAEFPGGNSKMEDYFKNNLKFPAEAKTAGVNGVVYVAVVIAKDGLIRDAKIKKDALHYGCGEEALRVVKTMPRWKPCKINGRMVTSRKTIVVKFITH